VSGSTNRQHPGWATYTQSLLNAKRTLEISAYQLNRLNATLGNLTELVIVLAALRAGQTMLIRASIAGAIVTNTLFIVGGVGLEPRYLAVETSKMFTYGGLYPKLIDSQTTPSFFSQFSKSNYSNLQLLGIMIYDTKTGRPFRR